MNSIWLPWTISLELLAWIVIALSLIKIVVIAIKPKAWLDFAGKIYTYPIATQIVSVVLTYLILSSLINSGIGFVEIFAVISLLFVLMTLSISIYSKEMMSLAKKLVKDKKFWKKAWFSVLVWVIISVLAILELFGYSF
jgi:hypothetical protein